ncbi:unnamed protein product [Linum tenue]|uniref:LOB domain-containing protein n=1 Tax=Linum tenue TaxID=586396 RepID=A0AAV0QUU4_9ROSI|nr:unnamed protein product [Linum tenue]
MGGASPCASCKLLRRRCAKDCIFAPYFPSDDPHKFAIVHKIFGASNVSKMLQVPPSFSFPSKNTLSLFLYTGNDIVYLFTKYKWKKKKTDMQEIAVQHRADAVSSLVYEANARVRDPVYGCVGAISFLQNQVSQLQMQLALAQTDILCIQMHHDPAAVATTANLQLDHQQQQLALVNHNHHDLADSKSLLLASTNFGATLQNHPYLNFATSGVNNVMIQQDPLKRESLWT